MRIALKYDKQALLDVYDKIYSGTYRRLKKEFTGKVIFWSFVLPVAATLLLMFTSFDPVMIFFASLYTVLHLLYLWRKYRQKRRALHIERKQLNERIDSLSKYSSLMLEVTEHELLLSLDEEEHIFRFVDKFKAYFHSDYLYITISDGRDMILPKKTTSEQEFNDLWELIKLRLKSVRQG
jgi:hypothetical protein